MIKTLLIICALSFPLMLISCDEVSDLIDQPTDSLISEEDAESQNYDLTTPTYGMQVAIDSRVDKGTNGILDLLDNRAEQFLDCQFEGGSDIGFGEFTLADETVVPPLSDLRVYVVPNKFKCTAVDLDVCAGIYFLASDIVVISEGGFQGCGEFAVWKHELGHRYGMDADHSNESDFETCAKPQDCDLDDIIDIGL